MSSIQLQSVLRDQGNRLAPLLEELRGQFPSTDEFTAWCAGLSQSFQVGQVSGVALWADERPVAALLYQASQSLVTLLAGLGRVDDEFLKGAVEALQNKYTAVLWSDECGADWAGRLASLGARPYILQTFVQDLHKVTFRTPPPDDVTIRRWSRADADGVRPLLAAANVRTLAGALLTLPDAPTDASIDAFLGRLLDAPESRFIPAASFVAMLAGQHIGVVLGVLRDDGKPFLLELATHPLSRGRSVARRLVIAMQQALLELGHEEMAFITTEANAPVQRLFVPEEIVSCEETRGGYWIRDEGT